jgi:hypothetical protein
MVCIYKITNPEGKVYIGQTVNFIKRINAYKNHGCKKQTIIYRSLLKHGFNAHKVEILEECDKSTLNERERFYQEKYSAVGPKGMNCRYVQTHDKSGTLSEETRERIRKVKTGVPLSKEHKKKIALSGIGRKHTDATKKKMSAIHSGKGNAMYGKRFSEEEKQKMKDFRAGDKNGMYGKKHSQETIEKITKAAQSRGNGWKKKIGIANSKKVMLVGENIVFNSIKDASKYTGISKSGVGMVCRGECKQMKGLVFKYYES